MIQCSNNTSDSQLAFFKDLNEFKMKIFMSISHKLKTPINLSLNLLQLMMEDEQFTQETIKKYILPISNNNLILLSFVDDICDYVSIEMGQFLLNLSYIDLKETLEECLELIEFQAKEKNLKILLNYDQQIPGQIKNNSDKIKQILLNLLNNAIKFSSDDNIFVNTEYISEKNLIKVSVIDKGLGISKKQQNTIFKIWDNNINNVNDNMKSRGIGFGLTIAAKLSKAIGDNNKIELKSQLQNGSEFIFYIKNYGFEQRQIKIQSLKFNSSSINTVYFHSYHTNSFSVNQDLQLQSRGSEQFKSDTIQNDIKEDDIYTHEEQLNSIKEQTYQQSSKYFKQYKSFQSCIFKDSNIQQMFSTETASLQKQKSKFFCCNPVLLVDDEMYNIYAMKMMMQQYQIPCDHATNGQLAVNKVKERINEKKCCQHYKFIFMDIDMPVMNGYDASKNIMEIEQKYFEEQKSIICVSSAYIGKDDKIKAKKMGITNFLDKPVSKDKLEAFLKEKNFI